MPPSRHAPSRPPAIRRRVSHSTQLRLITNNAESVSRGPVVHCRLSTDDSGSYAQRSQLNFAGSGSREDFLRARSLSLDPQSMLAVAGRTVHISEHAA